jgi:hypothetical protein
MTYEEKRSLIDNAEIFSEEIYTYYDSDFGGELWKVRCGNYLHFDQLQKVVNRPDFKGIESGTDGKIYLVFINR